MEKEEIVKCVDDSIKELKEKFLKNPVFFYTENDLHCFLFRLIYDKIKENEEWLPVHKEYPTRAIYIGETAVKKENYRKESGRGTRRHFDIVVFHDKCDISEFKHRNGLNSDPCKPFIAIQIGLDASDNHLINNWKSLEEQINCVDNKYLLHFDRTKHNKKMTEDIKKEVNQRVDEINRGAHKGGICYIDIFNRSSPIILATKGLRKK